MTRTITTAAELDALPEWAAVVDARGVTWVRRPASEREAVWGTFSGRIESSKYLVVDAPLTVLHDPSASAAPSATLEEVMDELLYAATEDDIRNVPGAARDLAAALLARFNITKEDR